MKNSIELIWNGKLIKGFVISQKNDIWWIVLDTGKSYLLAKDEEGWFCPSLKRSLAALIGEQIDRMSEHRSSNQQL